MIIWTKAVKEFFHKESLYWIVINPNLMPPPMTTWDKQTFSTREAFVFGHTANYSLLTDTIILIKALKEFIKKVCTWL